MITSTLRALLLPLLLVSLAACASGERPTWTYAPPPSGPPTPAPTTAPTATPAATETPSPTASGAPTPEPSGEPSQPPGEARVIELEMSGALQILRDGQQVTDIPVTVGETILFRVTNTAGYDHNFYIGPDDRLAANDVAGLPGIPTYMEGTEEFEWVVPEDATSLKFGCTVPGHYQLMNGTFSIAP